MDIRSHTFDRLRKFFSSGLDAVDGRKQRRLRALGAAYLSSGAQPGWRPVRFDVASVTPGPHGYSVQVVEAAF